MFAAGAKEVSFNSYEYPLFQKGGLASNSLTPDMDVDELFKKFHLVRNRNTLAKIFADKFLDGYLK